MNLNSIYFKKHQLNYMGNKRALLNHINNVIIDIKQKLNKDLLISLDGFSGTGIVARLLKYHSTKLYVNDLENYSCIINQAYLSNPSKHKIKQINSWIDKMNNIPLNKTDGIIRKYYSPENDQNIKIHDRAFYTNQNALIIDNIRFHIDKIPKSIRPYIMAQLLIKAGIHVNTSGVFKGFYKDTKTKIGKFGGNKQHDIKRIMGKINLEYPIYSNQKHKVDVEILCGDINEHIKQINNLDIAYYDPPYNQHPYGSNYFLLNTIIQNNIDYNNISKISGISKDWKRSKYNYKDNQINLFKNLIQNTDSKFIIIAYSNQGFLNHTEWKNHILKDYTYTYITIPYKKGVTEIMYIIDKRQKN